MEAAGGMDWDFYTNCFAALFAAVNPMSKVSQFLAVTPGSSSAARARAALVAPAIAFGVLTAFTLFGNRILSFFGITLPTFQIGGGILVLILAIGMFQGATREPGGDGGKAADDKEDEDGPGPEARRGSIMSVAVVPLAIPFCAGPAAISTALLYASLSESALQLTGVLICAALVSGLVSAFFLGAEKLSDLIGPIGLKIAARVMGLILAAIAVRFILEGLTGYFPVLEGPPGASGPASSPPPS